VLIYFIHPGIRSSENEYDRERTPGHIRFWNFLKPGLKIERSKDPEPSKSKGLRVQGTGEAVSTYR
jgi:hypothetical protein